MKNKTTLILILFLYSIAFHKTISAQSPTLSGDWNYKVEGKTIRVSPGKIGNRSNRRTGKLKVKIKASTDPNNVRPSGIVLYERDYNPLGPNEYYYVKGNNDIDDIFDDEDWHDLPSLKTGDYFVTLCLLEYSNDSYYIVDYQSMKRLSYSPPKSEESQLRNDNLVDNRDYKTYKTVIIGNKLWMAENLNYQSGGYGVCYDNKPENCQKYGVLYNWQDAQKVCPHEWHLPDKSEFDNLMTQLKNDGYGLFSSLMNGGHSGFNALNGGWQAGSGFGAAGERATFWTSTETGTNSAWVMGTNGSGSKVEMVNTAAKVCGFSVRCVKD